MKFTLQSCLAAFLFLTTVHAIDAIAQETQVAFDVLSDSVEGRLMLIDRRTRDELEMFLGYEQFEEARLYRFDAQHYTLEVTYLDGDRSQRRQTPLDSLQTYQLRQDIIAKIGTSRPSSTIDHSGRSHLLWTTTLSSFFIYGPLLSYAFDTRDAQEAATTYLLTGSMGFFVPFMLTANTSVTDGMAAGARVGTVLGFTHTLLAYGSLGLGDMNSDDLSTFYGVMTAASIGEMITGLAFASEYDLSAGHMNLIGVGGMFGAIDGQLIATAAMREETTLNAASALGLVTSFAGMYAAHETARSTNYTTGDAKAMMMGGLTGMYATLGVLSLAESGDMSIGLGLIVAGNLLGSYATHNWLGRRDLTDGEGNYVILGTIAGGLVGLGVTAGNSEPTTTILASSMAATAGFAIVMSSVGKTGRERRSANELDLPEYGASTLLDKLEFNLNPSALALVGQTGDPLSVKQTVPVASLTLKL